MALAGALGACLLLPALLPAVSTAAPPRPITGSLDRPGLIVVLLAPHGRIVDVRATPRFHVVPPAQTVTLHIRSRRGTYLGPVVVRGRGGRVTTGIRAGAKLGRIRVLDGYARVTHKLGARSFDRGFFARAHHGVPTGVGSLGWVRGAVSGPGGSGRDRDHDGIPGKFDVDDNGNLVLDARERRGPSARVEARLVARRLPLAACPAVVCRGAVDVDLAPSDRADTALIVAIFAAALAAASLLWQLLSLRSRRRQKVEVDVRLGLPIYQQGSGDWSVFVELLNGTEHPARWVSAALEFADGRRLYLMQQPPGGELPVVLQPHESHQTWTRVRDLERGGLDLTEPVVGIAKLDGGEILRSRRRRLLSRRRSKRFRE